MSLRYGPSWSWDRTSPEAIEVQRQAARFYRPNDASQEHRQDEQKPLAIFWKFICQTFSEIRSMASLFFKGSIVVQKANHCCCCKSVAISAAIIALCMTAFPLFAPAHKARSLKLENLLSEIDGT
jgi:hypothetical protein